MKGVAPHGDPTGNLLLAATEPDVPAVVGGKQKNTRLRRENMNN